MSKKPMKATPANVSRILSAAGHWKRRAYPSAIRGRKNYSAGFTCTAGEDCVLVHHMPDGYCGASAEVKRRRVESYPEALQPHFTCEIAPSSIECFAVKVTAKAAP